jgi:hypothetical protein
VADGRNPGLRHHETSFHPACPDPHAEQARQRHAAADAADLLFAIADPPTSRPLDRSDLERAAAILDRLVGLLTFGASEPELENAQALADHATALRAAIRSIAPG